MPPITQQLACRRRIKQSAQRRLAAEQPLLHESARLAIGGEPVRQRDTETLLLPMHEALREIARQQAFQHQLSGQLTVRIGADVEAFRHLRQQIPHPYIHQRRARLERVRHARDIDLRQDVVRKVCRRIEILHALDYAQVARLGPCLLERVDRHQRRAAMVAGPEARASAWIAILNELLPRLHRRSRQHVAALPRDVREPRDVRVITGHALVTAIASEHGLHILCGQPCDSHSRHRGAVTEWFAVVLHER